MPEFVVVFDDVVKEKLEKAIAKGGAREIIKHWLDELEEHGPNAGKLLDNHLWLYEMKNKHPPLRLYYHYQKSTGKIIIFELEMKTSEKKQNVTITKIKHILSKFQYLFWYIPSFLNFLGSPEVFYTGWCCEEFQLQF